MDFSNVMFFSGSICHEDFGLVETAPQTIARYSYRDYLRCVSTRLRGFLDQSSCSYLIYKGKPVLSEGRTAFHLHRAAHGPFAGTDSQVDKTLGQGKVVGTFARTASVASGAERYGLPKKVYFVQDSKTGEYDLVPDGTALPDGKKRVSYVSRSAPTTDAVTNSSSRILKPDVDQFVSRMLESKLGFPVFSVCDCNSFHTSGYLWGTYAIRSVMQPEDKDAVALLNFDQHPDIGGGAMVASDAWGLPALSSVQNGCYLSIGNSAQTLSGAGLGGEYKWMNSIVLRKDGKNTTVNVMNIKKDIATKALNKMKAEEKVLYYAAILASLKSRWTPVGIGNDEDRRVSNLSNAAMGGIPLAPGCTLNMAALDLDELFTLFFQALAKYLGRPIKYAFVTVDRDVIQNHHTQWGDNSLFPNGHTLVRTMSTVYDALTVACPQCTLIGVDITGLPESRAVYSQWTDKQQQPADAWNRAQDQVEKVYQWGAGYLARQYSPSAVFLHRLGIIFDNLTKDLHGKVLGLNVPSTDRSQIHTFWRPLRLHYESLQRNRNVVLTNSVRTALRPKLGEIAESLRKASRPQGIISKEAKSLLQAYSNRITSLLELEKD